MKYFNYSTVNEIILCGFPNLQDFHLLLFSILLLAYLFIITGNVLIFIVVLREPSLHTPMYFFIRALCIMEICYTAVTIPKMLGNLLYNEKMSLNGCILQAYFLHALGASECYLLTIMAYDRYLAICSPLHYPSIMNSKLSIQCVVGCFITGFLSPVIETIVIAHLPFCGLNTIQNVFCDFPPLIGLACTDTRLYILVEFVVSSFIILLTFFFVLLSYIRIIHVVLKIQSKTGRQKAFSTCGAHLVVVILFFGSITFMYLRLTKSYSEDYDRGVGLTYVVFTPLANPVIYGLRNQEIKRTLHKYLHFQGT
ncbi:olfactory receptor 6N2-like [Bombina bombina]|uniref:olfactory receptor 6N2-like n=1 Tax=Bombina bombina TaxID=8345 RepID=UPI00235A5F89|nr:olfactory receptor 6N2-like [Bombina bombina]